MELADIKVGQLVEFFDARSEERELGLVISPTYGVWVCVLWSGGQRAEVSRNAISLVSDVK